MQRLTAASIGTGLEQGLFARAAQTYAQRRAGLEAALKVQDLPFWAGSGLNVWVPAPRADWTAARLFREGWEVRTGSEFCLESTNGLRITISTLAPEQAPKLAAAIARHI